jgi:hypothetical protein
MTDVLYGHGKGLPVYGKILSLEIQVVIKVPHAMVSIYHDIVLKMCIPHGMVNVPHFLVKVSCTC